MVTRHQIIAFAAAAMAACLCVLANRVWLAGPAWQLLPWLASMLGLLASACPTLPRPDPLAITAWWTRRRTDVVIGLGVFGLALALRVYLVADVPINVHGDEGEMGLAARDVLAGRLTNPFTTGWLTHPTLWFFLQAASLRLFGDDLFGLRMLSALLGALSVGCWYALARTLYGRANALIAALLLAAYHFHIQMSRVGVNNIADLALVALALLAYFKGAERASPAWFVGSGLALGLSQYFYMGARLALIVLIFILAVDLATRRLKPRAAGRHLGAMALGFLFALGPLLVEYLADPISAVSRFDAVSYFGSQQYSVAVAMNGLPLAIIGQLAAAFGALYGVADKGPWYAPGMGLLDGFSFALFLVGLALAVQRARDSRYGFLLATVVGTCLLGGFLAYDTPNLQRYTPLAPALCQLIAFGVTAPASLISTASPRARSLLTVVSAMLVAVVMAWNIAFYFADYGPRSAIGFQNVEVATKLSRALNARKATNDEPFVFFGGAPRLYFEYGTRRFLAPDARGVNIGFPLSTIPALPAAPTLRADDAVWFVFTRERRDEADLVQARYPGGSLHITPDHRGTPLYWVYEVPAASFGNNRR